MDAVMFLKRTYGKKRRQSKDQNGFPFWDYRSRRGSMSNSSSGSEVSSNTPRSESENVSVAGSDTTDSRDPSSDPYRLTVHFLANPGKGDTLLNLYNPIFDWVETDLRLFTVTERQQPLYSDQNHDACLTIPSLAILAFLYEDELLGNKKITASRKHFETDPWILHHSESVGAGRINPYPHNSQDFFFTTDDFPLWGARQVHYGKEHIRFLRFVSQTNWEDTIDFYKLILDCEPNVEKSDFCAFTIYSHTNYDVQFALKRLPQDIHPHPTDSAILQFRVPDVGQIVPLFPNVCSPLSDTRWQTKDHDGNTIILQVTETPPVVGRFSSRRSSSNTKVGFFV
ncbi:protein FAM124A [Lingula anatina]|uniref:Protein FAM124A n=1 Tax=Lingula anatina TaxID=7574 RepID=A0A1S3HXK2_LINAN|nr:protein FAM124A [Lingula anatina]XP_013390762.1 protein FAM124A [Lingula anatina]XP_013390763.1 protein FAM124A [Lingula anatina]|eukprot:XP_013390761.1 protein FAM124A [Lingula anatina]